MHDLQGIMTKEEVLKLAQENGCLEKPRTLQHVEFIVATEETKALRRYRRLPPFKLESDIIEISTEVIGC